jgi:hypothetical protein
MVGVGCLAQSGKSQWLVFDLLKFEIAQIVAK